MPDYFTHAICAQKILENCKKDVKNRVDNLTLYKLGAQGGDLFFAYKLNFGKTNLGRKLHNVNAREIIAALTSSNISYAAGFATHYALDCTLHPIVYSFESSAKSPLAHQRFENDLGLYVSRRFAIPRNILPRERLLSATFEIYDCVVKFEPKITITGVERCLKRYFGYTRAQFKTKKQEFNFNYDYRSLSGAVDDAISLGVSCVGAVVSGGVKSNSSSELFSRSFLEK